MTIGNYVHKTLNATRPGELYKIRQDAARDDSITDLQFENLLVIVNGRLDELKEKERCRNENG